MLYCDSSFLAPLVRPESASPNIAPFVAGVPAGELAVSHLVRIELASALARDVRMGAISGPVAREGIAFFEKLLADSFQLLLPIISDFDVARTFIDRHEIGLRTNDALHLAIAHNHRCEAIYSLDKPLLRAGRLLGLPVSTGIALPGYE